MGRGTRTSAHAFASVTRQGFVNDTVNDIQARVEAIEGARAAVRAELQRRDEEYVRELGLLQDALRALGVIDSTPETPEQIKADVLEQIDNEPPAIVNDWSDLAPTRKSARHLASIIALVRESGQVGTNLAAVKDHTGLTNPAPYLKALVDAGALRGIGKPLTYWIVPAVSDDLHAYLSDQADGARPVAGPQRKAPTQEPARDQNDGVVEKEITAESVRDVAVEAKRISVMALVTKLGYPLNGPTSRARLQAMEELRRLEARDIVRLVEAPAPRGTKLMVEYVEVQGQSAAPRRREPTPEELARTSARRAGTPVAGTGAQQVGTRKIVKDLVRDARAAGLDAKLERGGHIKVRDEEGQTVGVIPATPGSERSVLNSRAELRRNTGRFI